MFKFSKEILYRNRRIIENFSYLSILQIFNLILPLITYPYLIRVLGKESFGGIVFAQAIISYLAIIVGYGFNISATKNISINKNNKKIISEIVSSVLIIKAVLFLISLIILYILLKIFNSFELNQSLFYFTMYLCLNELIFPVWYFQGLEKMKFTTLFNLVSRLIFVGLIFIFIKSEKDYLLVPIINGVGIIIAGLFSLYVIFFVHGVRFKWQKKSMLLYYIKDSTSLFISNAMVMVKEKSNIVLIGSILSMSEVSYYDLILKIASILRTPFMALRDAIFPNIAKSQNKSKYLKITLGATLISFLAYGLLIVFKTPIILFLGGPDMINSVSLVPLMGLIIPFGVLSMFMGSALILFFDSRRYTLSIVYSMIYFITGLSVLYLFNAFNLKYLIILLVTSILIEIISRTYLYIKK
ncbi:oligosaccharide flippase family protein [Maribacter sp. X9]|uniref:oligosaccharide flippase family protein n=1 Tax=Maribacter sp. X9 TaxID=3402159 RepID=UPI003AF36562